MKKLIFLSLMAICFCVRLYAQTNFKYKNASLPVEVRVHLLRSGLFENSNRIQITHNQRIRRTFFQSSKHIYFISKMISFSPRSNHSLSTLPHITAIMQYNCKMTILDLFDVSFDKYRGILHTIFIGQQPQPVGVSRFFISVLPG